MNILFICDEYPPGPHGGIGTMVQLLGRELVKQGHTVFVAGLYSHAYEGKPYEEDQGVKVWRMRYGIKLPVTGKRLYGLRKNLPGVISRRLNGKKAFDRFITFIEELIRKEKIDIIEIQDWNSFSFPIGFDIEWPPFPIPLVVKSNGSYTYFCQETGTPPDPRFLRSDQLLYQRADALCAVSHYTASRNRMLFNLNRPIGILYNSIGLPAEQPKGKRLSNRVVFSGTLTHKKGIYELIKAWNRVNERSPDAELIIYGKGNARPLKKLLGSRSASTVHFKGHVARQELLKELATATMAIFPSYSETFGFAPVEAMAQGCPTIYTARSCGPEIVRNNEEGLLTNPADPEQIAGDILLLLNDTALREKLSNGGYKAVKERFNIVQSAIDHIAFYRKVCESFKNKFFTTDHQHTTNNRKTK